MKMNNVDLGGEYLVPRRKVIDVAGDELQSLLVT